MARAKKQSTPADMVRSLVVLLIPVLLITWFFTRSPSDEQTVPTVDWKPVLAQARDQAPYAVLAPPETPSGWRATQVEWTPKGKPDPGGTLAVRNTWTLGFIDDKGIYVAVDQGDDEVSSLVVDATRSGVKDGTSQIGDVAWTRYVSADGRLHSLVLETDEVTSVVSGATDYGTLGTYTASLTSG